MSSIFLLDHCLSVEEYRMDLCARYVDLMLDCHQPPAP